MKSNPLLRVAFFLAFLFMISCEKETEEYLGSIDGEIVSHTQCKQSKAFTLALQYENNESCIKYLYVPESKKLELTHINAGFNCCPDSLYCSISTSKDTIIIEEFEKSALCDCNCLYDLDIEVRGVVPGKYYIKVVEPYCGVQKKLIFEIDLTSGNSGIYCVKRDQYPWGI